MWGGGVQMGFIPLFLVHGSVMMGLIISGSSFWDWGGEGCGECLGVCMGLCMRSHHRETDFPMEMMRFESFKRRGEEGETEE